MGVRPYIIVPYRGYGNGARARILGRVVRFEAIGAATETSSWWRNALATVQRMDAEPLRHARVRARVGDASHDIEADDEGFLDAWVSMAPPAEPRSEWVRAELTLDHPHAGPAATADIHVPHEGAAFGVVSDLDDTVLRSDVSSAVRAARLVLFENALTRLPFPGVAAFYRALARSGEPTSHPIFYVSSSPWNQYDVIEGFLRARGIPMGPILLRDWDIGRSLLLHRNHKREQIRDVFATYSGLPFILIGDSTQEDPEIYAELVHDYPGRILAVYIRNVRASALRSGAIAKLAAEVEKAGSALVLADDTVAAATHAAARGWISADALAAVVRESSS